ncbi:MAG: type I-E CRISPR-associated protein Cas6/Cse3/CasE [Magnetococcales bacterium]|nr:type I-E CRISPR-associated protein Cas6/Cse3/CasE [Magnetococcales bacterium]
MTKLNMIRIPIRLSQLMRWGHERGWSSSQGPKGKKRGAVFDEGRALHHLLDESFGASILRPFRLMVTPNRDQANLYAYSTTSAVQLVETMQSCAMPEHLSVIDPTSIQEKTMPDEWLAKKRFSFDLRIRPVRRLGKELAGLRKGAEIDAFLYEILNPFADREASEEQMLASGRSRLLVYSEWLQEKMVDIAAIHQEQTVMARYCRSRIARGGAVLEGPDVTLHGVLEVKDGEKFFGVLQSGIGRHKAYGYGMLLLRPAPVEKIDGI